MEIRNVRFSESSGVACGPVCGDTTLEVMFLDDEEKCFFVYTSSFDCDLQVGVSKFSLFDIMSNWASINGSEIDRAKGLFEKFEDYDVNDVDESKGEILDFNEYTEAVKITLNILRDFLDDPDMTEVDAKKKYLNRESEDLDSEYHYLFMDEDDEEDEE